VFRALSILTFVHSTLYGVTNLVTEGTKLVTHEESLTRLERGIFLRRSDEDAATMKEDCETYFAITNWGGGRFGSVGRRGVWV